MKWMWHQLDPAQAARFHWIYGQTPFSNLRVVYISWIVYLVSIIALRWFMAERRRLDGHHPLLTIYNAMMCLLTLGVHLFAVRGFVKEMTPLSLTVTTFCRAEGGASHTAFAVYLYYLLRFVAYLDTFILVLRKKSIPFLHWYHRMLIVLVLWSWLDDRSRFGSIAVIINSFVQIVKHYYFGCVSRGYGSQLKSFVFGLQVAQFAASITLTLYQCLICPDTNSLLLSGGLNVTTIYFVVRAQEKEIATTRNRRWYKQGKKVEQLES